MAEREGVYLDGEYCGPEIGLLRGVEWLHVALVGG